MKKEFVTFQIVGKERKGMSCYALEVETYIKKMRKKKNEF